MNQIWRLIFDESVDLSGMSIVLSEQLFRYYEKFDSSS